MFKLKILFNF